MNFRLIVFYSPSIDDPSQVPNKRIPFIFLLDSNKLFDLFSVNNQFEFIIVQEIAQK